MSRLASWLGLLALLSSASACFTEKPRWSDDAQPGIDRGGPDDGLPPDGRIPMTDMGDAAVDASPDGTPEATPPTPEVCNGGDDDQDGAIDEGFPLGMPCTEGQGACRAEGVLICAPNGMGMACDAVPGRPSAELCNGIDDDCSGEVDEGFEEVGEPCAAGNGICRTEGNVRCAEDGAGTECSVASADERATLETCNGLDDDCDGSIDEGLVRSCGSDLPGLCAPGTSTCAAGEWIDCVPDVAPGARNDVCNTLDDDCDNGSDEEDLPDGPVPCMPGACIPLDGCVPSTPCVRQCDPDSEIGTICAQAPESLCDGIDDDCDGVIDDDRVCGASITSACMIGFGWTTRALPSPSPEWGDCVIDLGGIDEDISCNGTRQGGFSTISLLGDLDMTDDLLGVAFRCDAGPIGDYIASHCRVFLGLSAPGAAVFDGAAAWGPCPAMPSGGDPQVACTSSTRDGGFLPMPLPFDLTADSLVGVAFICQDEDDPERARALQASVAVSLAWADASAALEVDWEAACKPLGDGDPYTACATTGDDARFRVMRPTADVDAGDSFAIRLEAR